jgi:sulfide:quinone oxidoreductase
MAHVVIIGASTAGLPAAYEIKEALGAGHQVTVVSNTPDFHFIPSNPWVGVGWRTREQISFPVAPYLEAKGIRFLPVAAQSLQPEQNCITLANGETLNYDYLVIATGPKLAFDEVPGLGPTGHTHSVCTIDHAEQAHEAWKRFIEEPGPIVVGAAQGASCFGPAYEFAFIMDADLRRRRIRDRVPMTFVTSEPYIGHLGLGGVGDSKGMLESELRQHDMRWITNARVERVEAGKMFVTELDDKGNVAREHEVPFKYSMMLPAFKGVDALASAGEELVNPRGFVKVDECQRNPTWRNVYSVGVCIAIPPVEATPVPTGTPKTGYMIESMVAATAANIKADVEGRTHTCKGTWNAICLADMGDTGVAFVAMPQIPPRNVAWMKKGKWVHYAKIAFEKYFISKMKKGSTEPIYEKYILKALGIHRLR